MQNLGFRVSVAEGGLQFFVSYNNEYGAEDAGNEDTNVFVNSKADRTLIRSGILVITRVPESYYTFIQA